MITYSFRVLTRRGHIVYIDIEARNNSEAHRKFDEQYGTGLSLDRHGSCVTILDVRVQPPQSDALAVGSD